MVPNHQSTGRYPTFQKFTGNGKSWIGSHLVGEVPYFSHIANRHYPSGNDHISLLPKRHFWVDDFPFPFRRDPMWSFPAVDMLKTHLFANLLPETSHNHVSKCILEVKAEKDFNTCTTWTLKLQWKMGCISNRIVTFEIHPKIHVPISLTSIKFRLFSSGTQAWWGTGPRPGGFKTTGDKANHHV